MEVGASVNFTAVSVSAECFSTSSTVVEAADVTLVGAGVSVGESSSSGAMIEVASTVVL